MPSTSTHASIRASTRAGLLALALASLSFAQQEQPPEVPPPPPDVVAATPPDAGRDVLFLDSGERLEGQLTQLEGGTYQFKSAALDAQKLPQAKVVKFDAGNPVKVVTTDGRTFEGPARYDGATLTVWTADGPRVLTMAEVAVINPTPPLTEREKWHIKLTLGFSSTQGNTHNKNAFILGSVTREDDLTRLALGYQSVYGTTSGEESAKSHRGDWQFDVKLGERFFLTPVVGNAYYDKFQNIAYRYRIGAGAGAFILKEKDVVSWSVETGPAYGVTRFRRIPPGADRHRYETSIRAATRLEAQLVENIAFKGFYESYIGAKDVEDTVHHAEAAISFKYDVWSIDFGVIYDRIERPARRDDGSLPRRDDSKFYVGLGVAI